MTDLGFKSLEEAIIKNKEIKFTKLSRNGTVRLLKIFPSACTIKQGFRNWAKSQQLRFHIDASMLVKFQAD